MSFVEDHAEKRVIHAGTAPHPVRWSHTRRKRRSHSRILITGDVVHKPESSMPLAGWTSFFDPLGWELGNADRLRSLRSHWTTRQWYTFVSITDLQETSEHPPAVAVPPPRRPERQRSHTPWIWKRSKPNAKTARRPPPEPWQASMAGSGAANCKCLVVTQRRILAGEDDSSEPGAWLPRTA